MQVILHADQKPKHNHKKRFCQLIHKNFTYWGKKVDRCWTRKIFDLWLLSVEEINSSSVSFEAYLEKTTERLTSGESKTIFRKISRIVLNGLTTSGRKPWQEEEETRKDFSIVLIHQEHALPPSSSSPFRTESYCSLKDNAIIPDVFFKYIYQCRLCDQCAFRHQFRIDTRRSNFEQQEFECQILKYSMRRLLSALNRINHNSHFKSRVSLEEQKKPKRGTFRSEKTDRLLDLRVLLRHWSQWFRQELCRPFYCRSSKWWYSGIRFDMGWNFILNDTNPIWWHLGRIVQIKNTRVWETQDRIGVVWLGDSSEESRIWLAQIEDDGEKKVPSRIYDLRILKFETEIMRQMPWSMISGQNSVNKELLEIVGSGKPTGSVLKETIAVSVTTLISVQKGHNWIRLRILSCNRTKRKRRKPEVPEDEVPVKECFDGHARIISKELAPIH